MRPYTFESVGTNGVMESTSGNFSLMILGKFVMDGGGDGGYAEQHAARRRREQANEVRQLGTKAIERGTRYQC